MININEKGITIITLIITVLLLTIITGTIAINTYNSMELSSLTMLEDDIKTLENRIASYYVENGELPIFDYAYTKTELQNRMEDLSINDGENYYVIDLSKIDNITLNYNTSVDTFIVNEETHNIYHLQGIVYDNTKYHTVQDNDSALISDVINNYHLPSNYCEVEYIESSGTQFIDTGVKSNKNYLKFEIKYSMTELPSLNNYVGIFGAYRDENSNSTRIIYYGGSNSVGTRRYAYVNNRGSAAGIVDDSTRSINTVYTETLERDGSTITYSSNAFVGLKSNSSPTNGNDYSGNIAIFAQNAAGSIKSKMRLYYFKIYDNQVLIRNFVPCYRTLDNKTGLYDTVNNVFYTSAGTEEFITKPAIIQNSLVKTSMMKEQNGTTPLILTNCNYNQLIDYKIYGNVSREGEPSKDNPATIYQVGDLVTNSSDQNYGKYKIPVVSTVGGNSVTTNIYLDEPLRGTDEYYDYIDFSNQKVYRYFYEKIFNGTESWTSTASGSRPVYFRYKISNSNILGTRSSTYQISNYFAYGSPTTSNSDYGFGAYYSSSGGAAYIRIRDTELTTANAIKAFLLEKYQEGNPVRFIYLGNEVREESITLPSILTLNGTNILSIGTTLQPSSMSVIYRSSE